MFRARSVPRGMSPQRSPVAEYIRTGSRPSSPATSRTASVIPVSLDTLYLSIVPGPGALRLCTSKPSIWTCHKLHGQ